jgi:hypothetical protein
VAENGWEIAGEQPAGGAQAAWPRSAPVRRCSGLGAGRGGAGEVGEALWQCYVALDAANCARGGVCSGTGACIGRTPAHGPTAGVQRSAAPPVRGPAGALPLYAGAAAGRGGAAQAGARTTGQLRTASGRGGRTAAQRSMASACARRG